MYLVVDNGWSKLPNTVYISWKDEAKNIVSHLISIVNTIGEMFDNCNKPFKKYGEEEMFKFRWTINCEPCYCEFTMTNIAVRDHRINSDLFYVMCINSYRVRPTKSLVIHS